MALLFFGVEVWFDMRPLSITKSRLAYIRRISGLLDLDQVVG